MLCTQASDTSLVLEIAALNHVKLAGMPHLSKQGVCQLADVEASPLPALP